MWRYRSYHHMIGNLPCDDNIKNSKKQHLTCCFTAFFDENLFYILLRPVVAVAVMRADARIWGARHRPPSPHVTPPNWLDSDRETVAVGGVDGVRI